MEVVNSKLMAQIDLRPIREAISEFIRNGTLDGRVIDALTLKNELVPKECELWDYKKQSGSDAVSLGKTVLQIVSFHNTYGGYLIFGVEEMEPDTRFIPVGVDENSLSVRQLKDRLRNYTASEIDITYREFEHKVEQHNFRFGLLHIPKRPCEATPVFFGKNGPEIEKGKNLFLQNESYIRAQDKCVVAKSCEEFQLLFGRRENPFLWDTKSPTYTLAGSRIIVDHNLPDRNFICPKFVGRKEILQDLWRWLADELVTAMVLAGDGGKGKTSTAYQFAEEVCRAKPYDVDKVIWLTAKKRQFVADLDEFVNVPETHFYDVDSLLKAICLELAILEREIEGASIEMLKKLVKNAMSNIPCFVVIDNVDSCNANHQRMILEAALQTSNSRSRFLLTTRMNFSYSNASCITVGGFQRDEYHEHVANLLNRMKLPPLTPKQIDLMRKTTDGSPQFTESLLRLCRTGVPIDTAIRQWEGRLGSQARKAALEKEIEHLTIESRRVLLACSLM